FRTYEMAVQLYKGCKTLELPYYLKDQLLRASSSIVLNISEGSGRMSNKDQRRFYSIAFGSTREVQSILDIIDKQYVDLIKTADSVAACLYCLLNPKK
ncbi:MAG: four helix bundle protein, partial [Deltaproteobacteria bacterium]|nr:four helix bundle protein [Deltaproteobacteria bacterium]